MSWSINICGRAGAVAAEAKMQLEAQHCSDPEQAIKAKATEIVTAALRGYPPETAVRIEAYGTQYKSGVGVTNAFKLEILPLHGFVG